jgi:hypothetical protein
MGCAGQLPEIDADEDQQCRSQHPHRTSRQCVLRAHANENADIHCALNHNHISQAERKREYQDRAQIAEPLNAARVLNRTWAAHRR